MRRRRAESAAHHASVIGSAIGIAIGCHCDHVAMLRHVDRSGAGTIGIDGRRAIGGANRRRAAARRNQIGIITCFARADAFAAGGLGRLAHESEKKGGKQKHGESD